MDVAALIREEWSSVGMVVGGLLATYIAARDGQWFWILVSLTLVIAGLRVLQAEGWILQEGITES